MKNNPIISITVSLTALFAAIAGATPAKAQDSDQTVLAGQRVGQNKIGETRASQLRGMGKPDDHYTLPGGVTVDSWGGGSSRTFYRQGITVQISTRALVAPLPGDITMASTLPQVLAKHAGLVKHEYTARGSGGGVIDYYDDQAQGIAFEFAHGMSPAPGDDGKAKLYAVIVHKPGMAVIPDVGETARHD